MPADLTREEIAAGVRLDGWRWMKRMHLLVEGRGGRNEGTIVSAWDNDAGTLIVRWDTGHAETPCSDVVGQAFRDPKVGQVNTAPISVLPDPSDPATAGCLLDLLGPVAHLVRFVQGRGWQWFDGTDWQEAPNLGTACFRAALARGRWG